MASTEQKREIQVFADWLDSGEAVFMGTLTAIRSRGKEIFSVTKFYYVFTKTTAYAK